MPGVKDFSEFWKEEAFKMDSARRCNLAAVMTQLAGLELCEAASGPVRLHPLKSPLSHLRPLTR
jgi:hypothetical protein